MYQYAILCEVPELMRNRWTGLVSSGDRSLRNCRRASLPLAGCPVVVPFHFLTVCCFESLSNNPYIQLFPRFANTSYVCLPH